MTRDLDSRIAPGSSESMRRVYPRRATVVCLALIWVASSAAAQIASGTLSGGIVDTSRMRLPGATVTVIATGTNAARTVVTDSSGLYVIAALPPGLYAVKVELNGFRTLTRTGVRVATGETVRLDLMLDVGNVAESLTVTADAPLLRGDTAGLGHVIENERIVDLPLNGRSVISLASLAPGVALPPPPAAPLPRINGGRPRTNEYLFDGISVLQPEPGQVAFFPNVDAIQEFKIESNSPPAEFGRFNGGVVNLTTKSGSNDFRGSGFEFLRNEALNARNAFAPSGPRPDFRRNQFGGVAGGKVIRDRTFFFVDYQGQRQTIARTAISTVPTALQRQGIFTEAINGSVPLIYDPQTTVRTGAGTATRTQFANNSVPLDRIDPVALALLARYPLPTSSGTVNNFHRTADETVDQDQFSVRLDHRFSGSDQAFGRLTRFSENFVPVTPFPEGSGTTSGTLGPQKTTAYSFASNYLHVFTNDVVNELRVGDTRRGVDRTAATLSSSPLAALGLPGLPSTARFPDTLPTISIGGFQQLGSPASTATSFATSVTEIADSLTWFTGRHSLKLGADLRWERLNIVQPAQPTGLFTFTNLFTNLPTDAATAAATGTPLASFLLGQVQQFSIDLQQDEIRNRAHVQEYFVQDDWHVSARATINAGVRYTLNFPSTELHNQVAVFNLETERLEYAGRDGSPAAVRKLHKGNFGPRVGASYRADDKTVVHGGYGLTWIEMAGITSPFTTPVFPFLQTVSQRTLDNITPAFVLANGPTVAPIPLTADAGLGQGVYGVNRDLGSGYVQQWHTSIQRELTKNIAVEVAYTGSLIHNVGTPDANLNQLRVEQLSQGATLTERVANPFFGQIPASSSLGDPTITRAQLLKPYPEFTTVSLYRNNVGTTQYNAFYTKLQQRLSGGLSYLVSYTRSKLLDEASSVFDASILTGPVSSSSSPADAYNRNLERDYSTGDIPHVFVTSAVWALPFGSGKRFDPKGVTGAFARDWMLTGILTLQSGQPIAVTQSTNNNAFAGFGVQRPLLVGEPELPGNQRTTSRWFNTAAFATAPQFVLGTASRNPVRGPAYRNLDVAVIRRIALAGGKAVEVRAEAFNVTNTPPLGPPNGIFGTAAFGSITTAGDPRVIQLGLKYLY